MEEVVKMPVEEIIEPIILITCFLSALAIYNTIWWLSIIPLSFAVCWYIFCPRFDGDVCGSVVYQSRWEELRGITYSQHMRRL
jgi:hypothetical protein